MKKEVVRKKVSLSLQEAIDQMQELVDHYNSERLRSAIGYIIPMDKLQGWGTIIQEDRENKLTAARGARKEKRLIKVVGQLVYADC